MFAQFYAFYWYLSLLYLYLPQAGVSRVLPWPPRPRVPYPPHQTSIGWSQVQSLFLYKWFFVQLLSCTLLSQLFNCSVLWKTVSLVKAWSDDICSPTQGCIPTLPNLNRMVTGVTDIFLYKWFLKQPFIVHWKTFFFVPGATFCVQIVPGTTHSTQIPFFVQMISQNKPFFARYHSCIVKVWKIHHSCKVKVWKISQLYS